MSMAQRSYQAEMLDADNVPFSDIKAVMHELDVINTYLGGHSITCSGVGLLLHKVQAGTPLIVAEIGCGGGNNLAQVSKYLKQKGIRATCIGVDIKEECLQAARASATEDMDWICSDYRYTQWPGAKPDIIFSSLFCHHFTDEQLTGQLKWLKQNAAAGFFINDLHRHPLAYYSIKLITGLFSKSALVKNDAPLSVKRGFKKKEWVRLLHSAGITNYTIKWKWAFRYLICVAND